MLTQKKKSGTQVDRYPLQCYNCNMREYKKEDIAKFNHHYKSNPYHGFTIQYDDREDEFWARENFILKDYEVACHSLAGLKSKIRAYRRIVYRRTNANLLTQKKGTTQ